MEPVKLGRESSKREVPKVKQEGSLSSRRVKKEKSPFKESQAIVKRLGDRMEHRGVELKSRAFKGAPSAGRRIAQAAMTMIGGLMVSAGALLVEESALFFLTGGIAGVAIGAGMLASSLRGKKKEGGKEVLSGDEQQRLVTCSLHNQEHPIDQQKALEQTRHLPHQSFLNQLRNHFYRKSSESFPGNFASVRGSQKKLFQVEVKGVSFTVPDQLKGDILRNQVTVDGYTLFETVHPEKAIVELIETLQDRGFSKEQIEGTLHLLTQTVSADPLQLVSYLAVVDHGFLGVQQAEHYQVNVDTENRRVDYEQPLNLQTRAAREKLSLIPMSMQISYHIGESEPSLIEHAFAFHAHQLQSSYELLGPGKIDDEVRLCFASLNIELGDRCDEETLKMGGRFSVKTDYGPAELEVKARQGAYFARVIHSFGPSFSEPVAVGSQDAILRYRYVEEEIEKIGERALDYRVLDESEIALFEKKLLSYLQFLDGIETVKDHLSVKEQMKFSMPYYRDLRQLKQKMVKVEELLARKRRLNIENKIKELRFDIKNSSSTNIHAARCEGLTKIYSVLHTVEMIRRKTPEGEQKELISYISELKQLARRLIQETNGELVKEKVALNRDIEIYKQKEKRSVAEYNVLIKKALELEEHSKTLAQVINSDMIFEMEKLDLLDTVRAVKVAIDMLEESGKVEEGVEEIGADLPLGYQERFDSLNTEVVRAAWKIATVNPKEYLTALDEVTQEHAAAIRKKEQLFLDIQNDDALSVEEKQSLEMHLKAVAKNIDFLSFCKQTAWKKAFISEAYVGIIESYTALIEEKLKVLNLSEVEKEGQKNPQQVLESIETLDALIKNHDTDPFVLELMRIGDAVHDDQIAPLHDELKKHVDSLFERLFERLPEEAAKRFSGIQLQEMNHTQKLAILAELSPHFPEKAYEELKELMKYHLETLAQFDKFERYTRGEEVTFDAVETPPIQRTCLAVARCLAIDLRNSLEKKQLG